MIHAPGYELAGGPDGVLLIHGFTASPTELRPLGNVLHQRGLRVKGVRLAGHGTSPADLCRTPWTAWADSASAAYADLAADCRRVYVAGLSMGAVLAVRLTQSSPRPPDALFLLAPAFFPHTRLLPLSPYAGFAVKRIDKGQKSQAYFAQHGLFSYPYMPTRALGQLQRLLLASRPLLDTLQTPTHIFMGLRDRTVRPASGFRLFGRIPCRHKSISFLPQSRHILSVEPDAPYLFGRIAALIQESSAG